MAVSDEIPWERTRGGLYGSNEFVIRRPRLRRGLSFLSSMSLSCLPTTPGCSSTRVETSKPLQTYQSQTHTPPMGSRKADSLPCQDAIQSNQRHIRVCLFRFSEQMGTGIHNNTRSSDMLTFLTTPTVDDDVSAWPSVRLIRSEARRTTVVESTEKIFEGSSRFWVTRCRMI